MTVQGWNGARRRGSARGPSHEHTGVSLTLPAEPASVGIARREVAAMGATMGLSERRIEDLKTLVSEACTNAAMHAYDGREGSLRLRAVPRPKAIAITVTDDGDGIRPRPASEGSSGRLGLLLMATLASRVEISHRPSGGTRLKVLFPIS